MPVQLKVLFLAAEADPLIKIGGLGDVAGSLPAALLRVSDQMAQASGQEVRVEVRLAIPLHGGVDRQRFKFKKAASFRVFHENGPIPGEAWEANINGVPVYLIAGWPIRADASVYTTDTRVDGFKYAFFSMAALELARTLDWKPDILHANDWHTAFSIYALSLRRSRDPFFKNTATLIGVHNLPYLGAGAGAVMNQFGLPSAINTPLPWWAQNMPLPVGLLTTDQIVAVSPHYALEILTPEFGSGLDGFLRSRGEAITGILNGLDTALWDPANDSALVSPFSPDHLSRRAANKTALQRELGLKASHATPLIGLIGRMDHQKGIDLAVQAIRQLANDPQLSSQPWQAVILGTGDPAIEAEALRLESDFPRRVRAVLRFDAALSRRIYGGADMLLIPSRYEPCGLAQMIAMRYGCIPIARATGGLVDTIQDFDASPDSTGFLFEEAQSAALFVALQRALRTYPDRDSWQGLQQRGMNRDFSWDRSAHAYLDLYLRLVATRQPGLLQNNSR